MDPLARILDASANRAREALRVMEDVARFRLGESSLCREIKEIRHDLRAVLDRIPGGVLRLVAARDVQSDAGRNAKTTAETSRSGLRDVAIAASKRAGEALRTLEECAKTFAAPSPSDSPSVGAVIESLRYRLYSAEQRLVLSLGTGRAEQWRLCILITQRACLRPWPEVARAAVRAGADCIQLRESVDSDSELLAKAWELKEAVADESGRAGRAPGSVKVIVNNRVDVALACEADGVHLGTGDLPIEEARKICGDRLLIGASTHNLAEARRAAEAGADYCGVGAMFASTTKARHASGPAYLREFLVDNCVSQIPYLAIGGITPANLHQLVDAGCRGIAVSGCVCAAQNPDLVCRELRAVMDRAADSEAQYNGQRAGVGLD